MIDKRKIFDKYHNWMVGLVSDYCPDGTYNMLLDYLDSVEFTYILMMDENRYIDGVDLRYRFGLEKNYDYQDIQEYLDDDRPCSVLEMMVALALKCEEHIMDDPDAGNRTGKWFWYMIDSLGLTSQRDERFDTLYCEMVVERFLEREYSWNGEGGLFRLYSPSKDLRDVEIWYQMQWYLNERSLHGDE